ncbi:MAG: hypothetical protein GY725_10560 [bacterium]|nr:hypothetical protein [bacterium]
MYLVVGLLYFMLTTTTPGITNTPDLQDSIWEELNKLLKRNLSKQSLAKIGWIATYYAAYSVEIWLLGVYAFDEW